jgi:hypothetical protein
MKETEIFSSDRHAAYLIDPEQDAISLGWFVVIVDLNEFIPRKTQL